MPSIAALHATDMSEQACNTPNAKRCIERDQLSGAEFTASDTGSSHQHSWQAWILYAHLLSQGISLPLQRLNLVQGRHNASGPAPLRRSKAHRWLGHGQHLWGSELQQVGLLYALVHSDGFGLVLVSQVQLRQLCNSVLHRNHYVPN